ncbi:MAG: type III-B CRISPR module RAMP protein Cmr4, partial [Planctomycetota bacterium]
MSDAAATLTRTAGKLFVIHNQTPLHPGCGTATGTVDLPVQRERHTGWPLVPASSIKGVVRDGCRRKIARSDDEESLNAADVQPELEAVFGPGHGSDARKAAGAIVFTDARLLAFPVRSLRGVFGWVTCAAALERLARDLALIGSVPDWNDALAPLPVGEALVPAESPLLASGRGKDGPIVLEEFELQAKQDETAANVAGALADMLPAPPSYDATRERMKTHLAIVDDEQFTHFAQYATEVVARIGLDYARKTVRKGALFYQEQLPPECLFYS